MAKRIRIKTDSKFHFVTFSVYKHIPVFRSDRVASEFHSNLKFYESKRQFNLLGYVIMPHHVHILIELNGEVTIISENVLWKKLGYIHNNPVKAGLVREAADYVGFLASLGT